MHSPNEMAIPPNSRIRTGVGATWDTVPVVPMSQRDTSGPMALLHNIEYEKIFIDWCAVTRPVIKNTYDMWRLYSFQATSLGNSSAANK